MKVRILVAALVVVGLAAAGLTSLYAAPTVFEGRWGISGTGTQGAYTGVVMVTRISGTNYNVNARLRYANGKTDGYNSGAVMGGGNSRIRTLQFYYRRTSNGMLDALNGGRPTTITVRYNISGDKAKMTGSWFVSEKSSVRGTETWTHLDQPKITGVQPKELEVGAENKELTILGTNLPAASLTGPADLSILTGNANDAKIKINRLLDGSDDGTSLKLSVTVAKDATPGKRTVRVLDARGNDLLTISPPELRLKLGGEATKVAANGWARVLVPDQAGGDLTIGGGTVEVRVGSKEGEKLTAGAGGVYTVAPSKAGWYYVQSTAAAEAKLTAAFVQKSEVAAPKKPWNFWYFPFYERGANQNLYCANGAYEKIDAVLGLKHDPDGYKKFEKSRHMDKDFKEPTTDEEKAKYDQTTTKGWAYCYARSTDSKKSWWGHCWGAVVASSIYRQPKDATVKSADGKDLSFNEEEVEGLLTDYFTNHSVRPVNYMNDCPPGRPTDKTKEPCDGYADDFFVGLQTGIRKNGLPLACNLRAAATDDDSKTEVWNHVVWKYEARFKEVEGKDDPTFVQVDLDVTATDDIFPSTESYHRDEAYVMQFKYDENGNLQRDAKEFQNWISADHFCPSYLWRIESALQWGTENEVMSSVLAKLEQLFKLEKINP